MQIAVSYPHLTIDDAGVARIGNTRFKVLHLAGEHYYYGWTAEELLRQHPDLKPEEVYSALTYFYDHREEMVARMEESAREAELMRQQQPISREELLRRKALRESQATQ